MYGCLTVYDRWINKYILENDYFEATQFTSGKMT